MKHRLYKKQIKNIYIPTWVLSTHEWQNKTENILLEFCIFYILNWKTIHFSSFQMKVDFTSKLLSNDICRQYEKKTDEIGTIKFWIKIKLFQLHYVFNWIFSVIAPSSFVCIEWFIFYPMSYLSLSVSSSPIKNKVPRTHIHNTFVRSFIVCTKFSLL
jgi:hypothetical protein